MGDGNISRRKGESVGVQIARGGQASYMGHYTAILPAM